MFRVTRYPMISKTESGRVGYRKKYRVAGRVWVPAGHCVRAQSISCSCASPQCCASSAASAPRINIPRSSFASKAMAVACCIDRVPAWIKKKVRRENEVLKKRDFNFDGRYLSQMSLFSQMWGIFGTAHAWIFRISWETKKKFTNIVAGAPRVSSSSFAKLFSSVFLTLTTLVFVSPAFRISQSSLLFIVTQHHVYLKCIS